MLQHAYSYLQPRPGTLTGNHRFGWLDDELTDLAAVAVLAGGGALIAVRLGASMTLLQFAIGALNDIVDAPADAGRQPPKAIPSGAVSPDAARVVACAIRDAEGLLGWLVVDNRTSGRPVDPRERELLEMLSEYLAIALRNARLYGEIAHTKRSLEQLIDSAGDAIITITADDRIDGWNPAAERLFGWTAEEMIGQSILRIIPPTPRMCIGKNVPLKKMKVR